MSRNNAAGASQGRICGKFHRKFYRHSTATAANLYYCETARDSCEENPAARPWTERDWTFHFSGCAKTGLCGVVIMPSGIPRRRGPSNGSSAASKSSPFAGIDILGRAGRENGRGEFQKCVWEVKTKRGPRSQLPSRSCYSFGSFDHGCPCTWRGQLSSQHTCNYWILRWCLANWVTWGSNSRHWLSTGYACPILRALVRWDRCTTPNEAP